MSIGMRPDAQRILAREKKKILFVDDEQNVRNALRRAFQMEGYDIAFARNGEEAMQMLAEYPVHLVVSDNKMPKMNGVDLVKKIRTFHPDTRCMMLTGFEDPALSTPQVSRCVDKVIKKPWNDNALKEAVSECLTPAILPITSPPALQPEPFEEDRPKPKTAGFALRGFDVCCYATAIVLAATLVSATQYVPPPADHSQMATQLERVLDRMDEMQALATAWASFDVD